LSRTTLRGICTIVLVALLGSGCARPVDPMTTPEEPTVTVIRPQRGDLVRTIALPGDVVGYYETALHSKVTGYLKTISVDKGDRVKAGEVLAQIEVPELNSNLRRAEATQQIARITYDRLKKVQQEDPRLVSQEDVDLAYAKYQETAAALDALQSMFNYTKIVAPFDGVITGRFADPGALIRAGGGDFGVDETSGIISPGATEGAGGHRGGGGPILTMAKIDKLRVYVYVPERSYPFIHMGAPAALRFDEFPNRVFSGKVVRFASSLDLTTRTMLTEIDIDNPDSTVYPRSYAHVTLNLVRHSGVLELPVTALGTSQNSSTVMLVRNGRLVEHAVETGINDGTYVEITSGLDSNSLVLPVYSNSLSAGQPVRYKLQAAQANLAATPARAID
jgi:membrane fusion protein, multidrug efflux system